MGGGVCAQGARGLDRAGSEGCGSGCTSRGRKPAMAKHPGLRLTAFLVLWAPVESLQAAVGVSLSCSPHGRCRDVSPRPGLMSSRCRAAGAPKGQSYGVCHHQQWPSCPCHDVPSIVLEQSRSKLGLTRSQLVRTQSQQLLCPGLGHPPQGPVLLWLPLSTPMMIPQGLWDVTFLLILPQFLPNKPQILFTS